MSNKVNPDRPHDRKCPECHAKMHCRAQACDRAEWIECEHCRKSEKLYLEDGVLFYGTRDPRYRRTSERIAPPDDFD